MTRPLPGIEDPGPIKHVTEGMTVIDDAGHDVGTVAEVKIGDPQAVTGQGQQAPQGGGQLAGLAAAFTAGTSLPAQQQERLVRLGYLRINGPGRLADDRYVTADHVMSVEGDRVQLDVPAAALYAT